MSLHVERTGMGSDLVLLHGWGLHSGCWSTVLPDLARHHRVHTIDLPGHGHSAHVPIAGFDASVDQVAACIPPGAALCGWSLGALVAQRIAARHPARVRLLALAGATPCFVERGDWPHGMRAATLDGFAEGLKQDRDATLDAFVRLNALHGARDRSAIRAFTRHLTEREIPTTQALEASLAWLRDVDLRAAVPTLGMPALVINGARDALVPIGAGRWLAASLPRADLLELPDAAHLPFFTHPDAFVGALESFVG
jgi:pimeloyl-[acyl-carrier protein] methyl ester esterase